MKKGLNRNERGVVGWMGLRNVRQSMRFSSGNNYIRDELTNLLMGEVGLPMEDCGSGLEGLRGVISKYKGESGVYIFINADKKRAYVGSSLKISRRMREYKDGGIDNYNLLREIKKNGWSGFRIIVIRISGGRKTLQRWEYKIMNKIGESGIMKLYNRFKSELDRVRSQRWREKGEREGYRIINRYSIIREKLRKVAKERGYGMRQRRYWFKSGEENINAKKIRVVDIREGTEFSGIEKEVARRTGGSSNGIRYSIKNGTRYKGRYELTEVNEGYSKSNTTLTGKEEGGNKEKFKGGKLNKKYKEVVVEDVKTGEKRVVPQREVPEMLGGSRRGVTRAIKEGKIYKGRYLLRHVEKSI